MFSKVIVCIRGKRILVSIETENNIFVSLVFFFKLKKLKVLYSLSTVPGVSDFASLTVSVSNTLFLLVKIC